MIHRNLDALRTSAWLHDLPPDTLASLAKVAGRRSFCDGELIAAKNEPVENIYVVLNGAIRDSTVSEDGREIVFFLVEKGGIWGLVAALDNEGAVHDAHAYGRTDVLLIPAASLHDVLKADPALSQLLVGMLCYRLRKAYEAVDDLGLAPLRQRLARQLYTLGSRCNSAAVAPNDAEVVVTQEELAVRVGATRSSVNRELRKLQSEGILEVSYGAIRILDRSRLYALCRTNRIFNR